jgi:hypothetical protein
MNAERIKKHKDWFKKYCLGIKKIGNVRSTPPITPVGGTITSASRPQAAE